MDGSKSATAATEQGYGRRFSQTKNPLHTQETLAKLAEAMAVPPKEPGDTSSDSSLPAAYTYFGQFMTHDMSLDYVGRQNPFAPLADLRNGRVPFLDLDLVYGKGPTLDLVDGKKFALGPEFVESRDHDLHRNNDGTPLIADVRNDLTAIVSQLHGLFLQMHNKLADLTGSFDEARRLLRLHYQYVVLNDFLPKLVGTELLERYLDRSVDGYKLKASSGDAPARIPPDLPIEFTIAAFRFHPLIRPIYQLNRLLAIETIGASPFDSLVVAAPRLMPPSWGLRWDLFVEPPVPPNRVFPWQGLQMAYKIGAHVTKPLVQAGGFNLALLNLLRGNALQLPSGQEVAKELGVGPLSDGEIRIGDVDSRKDVAITEVDPAFEGNCPLWAYVLAEASAARKADAEKRGPSQGHPRQLGDVGGRIVVETIVSLLASDPNSVLYAPSFKPTLGDPEKPFDLGAFITAASNGMAP